MTFGELEVGSMFYHKRIQYFKTTARLAKVVKVELKSDKSMVGIEYNFCSTAPINIKE